MKAKDIMAKDLGSISPYMTVKEALQILFEKKICGLPVIDEKSHLVGMFTEREAIRMSLPSYFEEIISFSYLPNVESLEKRLTKADKIKVLEVMCKDVVTVNEEAPLAEVARLMVTKQLHVIPVVRKSEVVGIITLTELIKEIAKRAGLI